VNSLRTDIMGWHPRDRGLPPTEIVVFCAGGMCCIYGFCAFSASGRNAGGPSIRHFSKTIEICAAQSAASSSWLSVSVKGSVRNTARNFSNSASTGKGKESRRLDKQRGFKKRR
jgi:hypothetical protein